MDLTCRHEHRCEKPQVQLFISDRSEVFEGTDYVCQASSAYSQRQVDKDLLKHLWDFTLPETNSSHLKSCHVAKHVKIISTPSLCADVSCCCCCCCCCSTCSFDIMAMDCGPTAAYYRSHRWKTLWSSCSTWPGTSKFVVHSRALLLWSCSARALLLAWNLCCAAHHTRIVKMQMNPDSRFLV